MSARPASPAPPSDDFDYAAAIAGEDRDILAIIAPPFLDNFPKDVAALREAWSRRDHAQLRRTAHSIKGTSGIFRATPLVEAARRLENYDPAGDGELDGAALIERIAAGFGRLSAALAARLSGKAAQ